MTDAISTSGDFSRSAEGFSSLKFDLLAVVSQGVGSVSVVSFIASVCKINSSMKIVLHRIISFKLKNDLLPLLAFQRSPCSPNINHTLGYRNYDECYYERTTNKLANIRVSVGPKS